MKTQVNLWVDGEVVQAAKDLGINLSRFFEEALRTELEIRAMDRDEKKIDKVKELRNIIAALRQQLDEQAKQIQKLSKENEQLKAKLAKKKSRLSTPKAWRVG